MLTDLGSALEGNTLFEVHQVQQAALHGVPEGADRGRGSPGQVEAVELGEGIEEGYYWPR